VEDGAKRIQRVRHHPGGRQHEVAVTPRLGCVLTGGDLRDEAASRAPQRR
jgi:hypothetical protein